MSIHKIQTHVVIDKSIANKITNPISLAIWLHLQFDDNADGLDDNRMMVKFGLSTKEYNDAVDYLVSKDLCVRG